MPKLKNTTKNTSTKPYINCSKNGSGNTVNSLYEIYKKAISLTKDLTPIHRFKNGGYFYGLCKSVIDKNKFLELKEKRKNIRKSIIDSINEFNKYRDERDKFNEVVKENKLKRCEMVEKIKNIIDELKKLNEEKKDLSETEEDARTLKKLINKKEWFFQINVMSFKKEEALMKELKGLKAKLKEADKKGLVFKRIRELIHELAAARQQHNEFHNLVIKNAIESDAISKKMKDIQKNIKSFKKDSKILEQTIIEESDKLKKIGMAAAERGAMMKKREEEVMMQKEEEAIAKLMNKKKVTSDDLTSMQ